MLRPGEHLSGKARRAFELQDAGQQIEVMTEMDFIRALQGGREDPWQLIARDAGLPGSVAPVLGPRRRPFTNLAQIPGENYWDWFDRVLRHPDGRAQGCEPCDHCGTPIQADAPWKHRDRHVCSSRCNESLKRRLKRAMAKHRD